MKSLRKLANLLSIQLGFTDTLGRRRVASDETLAALLAARGVHVGSESDCEREIEERREARTARVIPPSLVQWASREREELAILVSQPWQRARLVSESGEVFEPPSVTPGRIEFQAVPHGYYTLEVDTGRAIEQCWIAVAPLRAFERQGKRLGAFAPVYAIRNGRSTSVADVRDVGELAERLAREGFTSLGTLPMLASYLDAVAFEPSPYAAVSRLFWNELFVDLEALPELPPQRRGELRTFLGSDAAHVLRQARMVDYASEASWKGDFLSEAAEAFFKEASPDRRAAFDSFLRENPLARRYAEFRAATEKLQRTWPFWDEPARSGDLSRVELRRDTVHFHLYAQFVMHEQMSQLAERCEAAGCGLFLDFPLGSNSHGFDVWNEPRLFIRAAAIGAPPDLSYPQGQNWGFRPADPDAMRSSGYAHWIACIRQQLQCASMLRLDHVMGLHRLYVIPDGFGAADGAYLKYPSEDFYAILSIESHRGEAEIVGEDLGTVPPVVRRSMREHGIKRLYVVQRQLLHGEVLAPASVGSDVVASLNNHDMPPFRAFWEGSDIPEKLQLGVIAPSRHEHEEEKRQRARLRLAEHLIAHGFLEEGDRRLDSIFRAALRYLASSDASLVQVSLEDLWLESESQNIPTTSTERPNWRFRFIDDIEKLLLQSDVRGRLDSVRRSESP